MSAGFDKRINYQGDISDHLKKVAKSFSLGDYVCHELISKGYEDFNVALETTSGKYFVKYFASSRSDEECTRYVGVVTAALEAGVQHPNLLKASNGECLNEDEGLRCCVLEFIEAKCFFELRKFPTDEEAKFIIEQAAKINQIDFQPQFVYDSWAIVNFGNEFEKKKGKLDSEDRKLLEPLVKEFNKVDFETLPHAFVHGDIIETNILKDNDGQIWITDFGVANWYPRIVELAVMLATIFFYRNTTGDSRYDFVVDEYQKYIKLTEEELKALPVFVKFAHAMHFLSSGFEKANGNNSEENEYWLEKGGKGLLL